jgi:tetratricopeptide (TPR) repeat protein
LKNGDYPKVASALESLVKMFPARVDLWFNFGLAQYNAKNALGAVEAFQRALALSPEDRTVGLMLSRSFVAAGNTDAAADTIQDMRRRNPLDLALLLQLGKVYEAGSQPARAFAVYRSALDITAAPPLDFYLLLIRMSALLKRSTETTILISEYLARGGEEGKVAEYSAK